MTSQHHLEIEIKIPCPDFLEMTQRLLRAGLTMTMVHPRYFEDNWMFDTVDANLKQKKAALRVRLANGETTVTYKGFPKVSDDDPNLKVREELEVPAGDPVVMQMIFERLGYLCFFRYQKHRTVYQVTGVGIVGELEAMFDETPIGNYLELEGTQQAVTFSIRALGFSPADFTTDSYIELQKMRCDRAGKPLEDMIFPERQSD